MAKRHTEEQIIAVLKEAEAGTKTGELCRQHGISDATFYKWKAKYTGLEVSDLKKMRTLEDENRRLKQIVADQTLDIQALKAVLSKKF
ncbi:MAG: transposase [Candidatus Omnitrophica bacterium]|nr:transposase [Candidatus Omnitrophota bacterium]